jgi:hypothetical protein
MSYVLKVTVSQDFGVLFMISLDSYSMRLVLGPDKVYF